MNNNNIAEIKVNILNLINSVRNHFSCLLTADYDINLIKDFINVYNEFQESINTRGEIIYDLRDRDDIVKLLTGDIYIEFEDIVDKYNIFQSPKYQTKTPFLFFNNNQELVILTKNEVTDLILDNISELIIFVLKHPQYKYCHLFHIKYIASLFK